MNSKKEHHDRFGLFIEHAILKVLRIMGISLNDCSIVTAVQFIKFGVVGVSNTIISYVLNVAIIIFLRPYCFSWDYVVANTIAFFLSVLWSFYWNNRYVFSDSNEQRSTIHSLIKTYIAYSFTGVLLSNILSYVWINVFEISKYVAPLINLLICVPLNYIINKYWAFK